MSFWGGFFFQAGVACCCSYLEILNLKKSRWTKNQEQLKTDAPSQR